MALRTYAEQLEEVQDAISAILTKGQSYSIEGRTYTRANLKDLQDREAYLRPLVERESRGGLRVRLGVPRV